jgi:hypothetical protein
MLVQEIAELLMAPRPTIQDMLTQSGITPRGKVDTRQALAAIYRLQTSRKADPARAAAQLRKEEAEARRAEIEAMKALGEVVLKTDHIDAWSDLIARGVSEICALPGLTDKQKDAVFSVLRNLRVE